MLESRKVGGGLPSLELGNGAGCVFKYILQRPKRVDFEELVRMVVGSEFDWSRKARGTKGSVRRTKRGLERGESFGG